MIRYFSVILILFLFAGCEDQRIPKPRGYSRVELPEIKYKKVESDQFSLEILEDAENSLPGTMRHLLKRLNEHFKELSRQVEELELQIKLWHKENEASQKLEAIPGLGPITASAIVATVGNAKEFKNGRQLAAWLGLVPKQHSSGGKPLLLGISKRGDAYLRTLMVHGARSAVRVAVNKQTPTDSWTNQLSTRRHMNVVSVARANKNARIAWALLAHKRDYDGEYKRAA